jgi:hypothetical protein
MFKTSSSQLLALLISQTRMSQSTLVWDFSLEIQVSIPEHGYQNILIK